MTPVVAARLHVYLAREAPVGVILRRGPAKHSCLIRWDRERDTFEVGQWVKQRVLEDSCDLSPDGQHLLFKAMDHGDTYTALSRVPYFTALAWTEGVGRTGKGGLFLDNQRFWMPYWGAASLLAAGSGFAPVISEQGPIADDWSHRLERHGWAAGAALVAPGGCGGQLVHWREVSARWRLERTSGHFRLCYAIHMDHRASYALWQPETEQRIAQPDWSWADCDRHRLVWTAAGCLWTAELSDAGLGTPRCLFDCNPLVFEERVAPYAGVHSGRPVGLRRPRR